MPIGYLVDMGANGALNAGDAISATQSNFTIDRTLGTGQWNWTGVWETDGQTYSNITDTGVYYLGSDGNVYFVPDNWYTTSGTASATSTPTYSPDGTIDGTTGADTISDGYIDADNEQAGGDNTISTGAGTDTVFGGAGNDKIDGGRDNDSIDGGDGGDTIFGGQGDDTITGNTGFDSIYGGDGSDSLSGGDGFDTVFGGTGNDSIDGGNSADVVYGGLGNDTIVDTGGTASADIIYGGSGNDSIDAGQGNDFVYGGSGTDTLSGGDGTDTIQGGGDGDIIYGGDGNDVIDGDATATGTAGSANLSWIAEGPSGTQLDSTFTQSTGGMNIEVQVTDDGNASVLATSGSTQYVEAGEPFATASSLQLGGGAGPTSTTTISFEADPNSGLSDEVQNVSFRINDIDQSTWVDIITINAYDANGNLVPVTITIADPNAPAPDTVSGNTITGGNFNDSSSTAAGSALIEIAGPVAYFEIIYENGGTAGQALWITDVHFDTALASDTAGQDTLFGGAGDDSIFGNDEVDTLYGGDGNDTLDGGENTDFIYGGAGDDLIIETGGSLSDDTIYGGDGNDSISGGDREDLLSGDAGNDTIEGGTGTDTVLGGQGADSLSGGADADTIFGDSISINPADYPSSGGAATNLTITNLADGPVDLYWIDGSGALVYYWTVQPGDTFVQSTFDTDNWVLTDENGQIVQLIEGAPNQTVTYGGTSLNDTIDGGAGNDTIDGQFGDDSILGGAGDDIVYGGSGNDSLFGNDGSDTISGGTGDDYIDTEDGVAAADTAYGGEGNDEIITDGGNDYVEAGTGNDTVYAGADADSVLGGAGDDLLFGGTGNDSLIGNSGNDTIYGGDGDDYLSSGNNDNIDPGDGDTFGATGLLDGGAGNDTLEGSVANDTLVGGDGADSIDGADGDDTIFGGAGDTILGGGGSDTIILNPAELDAAGLTAAGISVDGSTTGSDVDTLDLSAFEAVRNFTQAPDADGDSTSGTIEVLNANGDWVLVTFSEIENFVFPSDGTVEGTAGADTIGGSYTGDPDGDMVDANDAILPGDTGDDDLIYGYGGADNIFAGDGNDEVYGGTENDTILGGQGNDTLSGDAGDDYLLAENGNDTVYGGDGNDEIAASIGSDEKYGGAGDDIISAGGLAGAGDTMFGDPGNDSFLGGLGNDTIYGGTGNDTISIYSGSGTDIIEGGEDVGDGDIDTLDFNDNFGPEGVDVTMSGDENGTYTFPVNGGSGTFTEIENINLTDQNDTFDGTAATGGSTVFAEAGDDTLIGSSGNDSFGGGVGNDTITANAGDDIVDGGDGNDTVFGGDGQDTVLGGVGNDALYGGAGVDSIDGEQGDDIIEGGAGADTLTGGAGSDTITGGADQDAIYGGVGDVIDGSETGVDNDTLYVENVASIVYDTGNPENGTVFFNGGGSLTFTNIENVVITDQDGTVEGTAGADVINGSYTGDPDGDMVDAGDAILPGDTGDDDLIYGYGGADSISAGDGNDEVYGGTENDTISGGSGNDTIFGGDGNDSLTGGSNSDTVFGGAGDDTITDSFTAATMYGGDGADTFNAGYGDSSIVGGEGGTDMDTLSFAVANDTVNVVLTGAEAGTYADDDFDNGTFAEIENFELTAGADTFDGSAATTGNHTVSGEAGNDTLTGGGGNDTLYGGADQDTFFAQDNFGDDVIVGGQTGNNYDTLDLSGLTNPVSVVFSGPGAGTVTDLVTGDTIVFSEIEQLILTNQADVVDASLDDGYTYIQTLEGNDSVLGSSGDDVYDDEIGVGTALDGQGDDTFFGGAGNDEIWAGNDNDTIYGGTGADTLNGQGGNDTIYFAEGDTATGDGGDDLFVLEDLGETGNGPITIVGGNAGESVSDGNPDTADGGDTLQLGSLADLSTLNITSTTTNSSGNTSYSGSVTLDDGTILNFSEIENIICFTPGTRIATPRGAVAIENLKVGDLVVTRDHGLQPIRWIEARTVPGIDRFAPVRIRPGVLTGQETDLVVSPQHRLLFRGYRAELLFGESEVLVAAKHLVDGMDVTQDEVGAVTYIHMMFDRHEVVYAEGAATESFHPGDIGFDAVGEAAREELFAIFPELRSDLKQYGPTARRCLKPKEAVLLR